MEQIADGDDVADYEAINDDRADLTAAQKALSAKELTVLKALLEGMSHEEAGRLVKRSRRSIQAWVQRPAFRTALREGQDSLFREACTFLHFNGSWAVQQLRELILDPKASDFARAWAARSLVDLLVKSTVPNEQSAQLAEIRQELEEIRASRGREAEG